ncbi:MULTISPECIES: hypothetical protein [Sphingopyxis]|jgi:hypothetical protein|nr:MULTISPECIES: hypothetical protein [Sphingopyxis]QUM73532.1 hypothetical protein ICN83_06560 [Sphingopyxis granuli]UNK79237.1 hypothetical protein MNQ96_17120 [Sphingopyxis granuli]
MGVEAIDIDSIPLLDTAVGLFGSLAPMQSTPGSSVFEVTVTVVLIIYD